MIDRRSPADAPDRRSPRAAARRRWWTAALVLFASAIAFPPPSAAGASVFAPGSAAPQVMRTPAMVRAESPGPVELLGISSPEFSLLVDQITDAVAAGSGSGWTILDLPALPRSFSRVPAAAREVLTSRHGGQAESLYHERLSALLLAVVQRAPSGRLGVFGLPIEADPRTSEPAAINAVYAPVLQRVGAMVSERLVIRHGIGGDTRRLRLGELMPEAHRLAAGRPILFRLNRTWRMAEASSGPGVAIDPGGSRGAGGAGTTDPAEPTTRVAPAVGGAIAQDGDAAGGLRLPPAGADDRDGDGVPDDHDGCPDDAAKTNPGACGCGIADDDYDGDGWPDCVDGCPEDPTKYEPGACGCGVPDLDGDGDGVLDCADGCPDDPDKTEPGDCGCGNAETPGCHPAVPMGVNLEAVEYFAASNPFVNIARTMKQWVTQDLSPGGPWDTRLLDEMTLDPNGYPIGLPQTVPGRSSPQVVATLMMRSIDGVYPGGTYICTYEGTGSLDFGIDAREIAVQPGRIVLDVTPSNGGISMRITSSDPADHVRAIRIVRAEDESLGPDVEMHPDYVRLLGSFDPLRTMVWQRTNDSTVTRWGDRTPVEYFTQIGRPGISAGVAPELLVELAKATGKDLWVCIPHMADDGYVDAFADLLARDLPPGTRVWVEYSNEIWNTMFQQHAWVRNRGLELGLATDHTQAWIRYQVQRSLEIFEIFDDAFGDQDRVIRVMASQNANPWISSQLLERVESVGGHVDVLATAPYFGHRWGRPDRRDQVRAMSVGELIDVLAEDVAMCATLMQQQASIAEEHGVEFCAYEGGQHLVGVQGVQDDDVVTALFIAANRDPRMGDLLGEHFRGWAEAGGRTYAMFALTGRFTKWGSWGHLEHQWADASEAPKLRAVVEAAGASWD